MQDPKTAWLRLGLAALFGMLLNRLYAFIAGLTGNPWLLLAASHSLVALLLLCFQRQRFLIEYKKRPPSVWLPATVLLSSTLLLALGSRLLWSESPYASPLPQTTEVAVLPWLGLIFWVPLVEELVFRFGLGPFLRQKLGFYSGIYLTSIIFALAHGPSAWGLLPPLGPLLLALCCELIYWRCGSIFGPILFHAACNATPLIFLLLDRRWLNWLSLLYLQA